MSIWKIYEIGCDECGEAYHGYYSVKYSEKCYRKVGGIVTKDKKHFCDKKCQNKFKDKPIPVE